MVSWSASTNGMPARMRLVGVLHGPQQARGVQDLGIRKSEIQSSRNLSQNTPVDIFFPSKFASFESFLGVEGLMQAEEFMFSTLWYLMLKETLPIHVDTGQDLSAWFWKKKIDLWARGPRPCAISASATGSNGIRNTWLGFFLEGDMEYIDQEFPAPKCVRIKSRMDNMVCTSTLPSPLQMVTLNSNMKKSCLSQRIQTSRSYVCQRKYTDMRCSESKGCTSRRSYTRPLVCKGSFYPALKNIRLVLGHPLISYEDSNFCPNFVHNWLLFAQKSPQFSFSNTRTQERLTILKKPGRILNTRLWTNKALNEAWPTCMSSLLPPHFTESYPLFVPVDVDWCQVQAGLLNSNHPNQKPTQFPVAFCFGVFHLTRRKWQSKFLHFGPLVRMTCNSKNVNQPVPLMMCHPIPSNLVTLFETLSQIKTVSAYIA